VVKTIREGQAAAIHEERSAANVKNVAAIDAFGNPGAAVGELIMRLAGICWRHRLAKPSLSATARSAFLKAAP
jgi:hypothetical protein